MPAPCVLSSNSLSDVLLTLWILHRHSSGLLESLVAAVMCLLQTMPVQGGFAIEVFAGTIVFTLGLLFARVPCLRPWDAQFGDQFDLITNGQILIELVKAGDITAAHLATPCQSQAWARVPALRVGPTLMVFRTSLLARLCWSCLVTLWLHLLGLFVRHFTKVMGTFPLRILGAHGCGLVLISRVFMHYQV